MKKVKVIDSERITNIPQELHIYSVVKAHMYKVEEYAGHSLSNLLESLSFQIS